MQSLLTRASEDGITHVLSGEVLRTPKGLTVTSRLTDLRRNVELSANRQEALQPDEALSASTSIASVVKQGLGLPGTEKVDVFAANFASRNITAYEAFIAGMQDFLSFDYEDARRAFEVAVQKAPDFAMARYRLAHTLASLGDTDGAMQQIEAAKRDAVRLPSRERAYIAAAESYFRRDYLQAEKQYRELLEEHPYETEARLLLLYVLIDQGRNEEALAEAETLAGQDPGDEVAWSSVADLNLRLGHYDEADEALRKLVAISPANPNAYYLLGESRLFRGEYDEAVGQYDKALQVDPGFGDAAMRQADIDVLRNRPQAAIGGCRRCLPRGSSHRRCGSAPHSTSQRCCARRSAVPRRCRRWIACMPTSLRKRCAKPLSWRRARAAAWTPGDVATARRLAMDAVARSPGNATRYLFTRGLTEVAAGDTAALQATVNALRALAAPASDPDRGEEKAAITCRACDNCKAETTRRRSRRCRHRCRRRAMNSTSTPLPSPARWRSRATRARPARLRARRAGVAALPTSGWTSSAAVAMPPGCCSNWAADAGYLGGLVIWPGPAGQTR